MKRALSLEEKEKLEKIYYSFLNNPKVDMMKDISMHRGSNCYLHSFQVAKLAIKRALKRKKKLDLESILIASILHDYYLYDWRKDRSLLKKHGSKHPYVACNNAKRDFGINDKVASIILSHMWPINFKCFPKTIEARIVNNADTYVAFKEAMTSKIYKAKRIERKLKYISELF